MPLQVLHEPSSSVPRWHPQRSAFEQGSGRLIGGERTRQHVYSKDSPLEAICYDDAGRRRRITVMAHDSDVATTRIDRPAGEWIRAYVTRYLEGRRALRWFNMGTGRAWVISAQDMYRGLEELMSRSITIYSSREHVEALLGGGAAAEDDALTRVISN